MTKHYHACQFILLVFLWLKISVLLDKDNQFAMRKRHTLFCIKKNYDSKLLKELPVQDCVNIFLLAYLVILECLLMQEKNGSLLYNHNNKTIVRQEENVITFNH